ncbi:pre-toxin TG domain-containing protein [Lihuaxuella thermophila]|uniref:Pre-toxin TG n=1 Tax=Lihuaxuella thermophila TaxID=1173111 RepID=A0A1H8DC56_9BACL|nr:pre-toxin TG domain-containing protein [Lihuaxuella thermophila]SEN04829.1 Pre-toxin TG [Lihuaxuella thermophila]
MWHPFKDFLVSKRGSSTLEYVLIIGAGVLLAIILILAINSDEIKTSLETSVRNAIEGKVPEGGHSPQTGDVPENNSPGFHPNGSAKRNVNTSHNVNSGHSVPVNDQKDNRNLWEKGLDYVFGGWNGPGKAWDRVVDDWNKMWDNPGEYWSEVFGWEDIKNTWNQLTSEPVQYLKDTWDRTWNEIKGVWNDPLGTGQQLLEDVIGINDAKAFWNGVDPESGEELSILERVIRGVEAVPIPHTKAVKLVDKGLEIGKKLFIKPACGKKKGNDSCPVGKHEDGNGLLSSDGKFKDPTLESYYQKYLERKAKEGKTPRDRLEWKEARDYWLKDSPMARGNRFNKKAEIEGWYPYNEVHLSNGKRLDSYDPIKGEIVSRKATDLDMIDMATFEAYLKELKNKYKPGTKIRSNKYRRIDGQELKGKQILEIPASNRNFSEIQDYIDLAKNKYGIEIRFREE